MAQPLVHDMLQQARRTEEAQLWAEVEATRRYRQTHPEHTQTVSAEAWDRLTAHLDEEDGPKLELGRKSDGT